MVTVMRQFNTYSFVGYGTKILILALEIVGWFGSLPCDAIPVFIQSKSLDGTLEEFSVNTVVTATHRKP